MMAMGNRVAVRVENEPRDAVIAVSCEQLTRDRVEADLVHSAETVSRDVAGLGERLIGMEDKP